jgi:hypothetical protein
VLREPLRPHGEIVASRPTLPQRRDSRTSVGSAPGQVSWVDASAASRALPDRLPATSGLPDKAAVLARCDDAARRIELDNFAASGCPPSSTVPTSRLTRFRSSNGWNPAERGRLQRDRQNKRSHDPAPWLGRGLRAGGSTSNASPTRSSRWAVNVPGWSQHSFRPNSRKIEIASLARELIGLSVSPSRPWSADASELGPACTWSGLTMTPKVETTMSRAPSADGRDRASQTSARTTHRNRHRPAAPEPRRAAPSTQATARFARLPVRRVLSRSPPLSKLSSGREPE